MNSAGARVEEVCTMREEELEQLHRAQKETLELELSWLPKPRIKYTKRFLELQKTKAGLWLKMTGYGVTTASICLCPFALRNIDLIQFLGAFAYPSCILTCTTSLVRLHQYHDAHTVHKALVKLQPVEEKAFLAEYNAQIALKRQALEKRQAHDREKLRESLTDFRLREERERNKVIEKHSTRLGTTYGPFHLAPQVHVMLGLKILHFVTLLTWLHIVLAAAPICYGSVKSKLKHSERSMGHAHVMALKRRPELAQKPSAHWQQRAHFASSAAALRGEQLAQAVKGKASGSAIKVADLTSIHDFGKGLSGTVSTYEDTATAS
ncbi:unnamed protein product [Ectocarpus sp. CCAP 1310/34]|nr:unnamed protein product [Ectocarpus sp. CCAP 1310/34]